jgi:hypothetical protein
MNQSLKSKRDELRYKWLFINTGQIHQAWKYRQWSLLKKIAQEKPRQGFDAGFNAAIQAVIELLGEFNQITAATDGMIAKKYNVDIDSAYIQGARSQHEQMLNKLRGES